MVLYFTVIKGTGYKGHFFLPHIPRAAICGEKFKSEEPRKTGVKITICVACQDEARRLWKKAATE